MSLVPGSISRVSRFRRRGTVLLASCGLMAATFVTPQLIGQQPAGATAVTGTTAVEPTSFHAFGPRRFVDTRAAGGQPLGAADTMTVPLPVNAYPELNGATSVVLNVFVLDPTAGGHLIVFPGHTTQPNTSNINFARNQMTSNLVTVEVGDNHTLAFSNASGGTVNIVVDLYGYSFAADTGDTLQTVAESRLVDTRVGTGVRKGAI